MKTREAFYEQCIDSKIAQCDLKARSNGRSYCTRNYAAVRQAQATFFEDQKELLVQKMMTEDLGIDLMRINSFLSQAFLLAFPKRIYSKDHEYSAEAKTMHADGYDLSGSYGLGICESAGSRPQNRLNEDQAKYYESEWSDGSLIADEDEDDAYS